MVERSYDEYFRECYPQLVALGAAMCGDRELARELAQETMIRAHHRWDEIQHYEHPRAWSKRVMTNLLIDQHRSRTAERSAIGRLPTTAVADLDGSALQGDTGDDPPRSGTGAVERWATLLEPLTVNQRAIATLYYAEDHSIASIADELGMTTGAVKAALFKIRRRLRRSLGQEMSDG